MIYDQIINILMVAFGTEIVRLYFQVFCWKRRNPHKTRWAVWLLYVVFQIIIMIYNASHPLAIDNKYSVGFSSMQTDIRCGVQACGISGWNIIRSMDVSRGSYKLCIDIDWSCITREWIYSRSYYFQDCYVYSTAYNGQIYKSGLYG